MFEVILVKISHVILTMKQLTLYTLKILKNMSKQKKFFIGYECIEVAVELQSGKHIMLGKLLAIAKLSKFEAHTTASMIENVLKPQEVFLPMSFKLLFNCSLV